MLLDAGVPDSVGRAMETAGHIVIYHREVLPPKTPDEVVCLTALENKAILVAVDGDMKQFAKRYGQAGKPKQRFHDLSVILICCNEVIASKRIAQTMSLIEHEWMFAQAKKARRLWIDIASHSIKSNR